MSARRRVRVFAAPFVVTIAACGGGGGGSGGWALGPTGSPTPWADSVRAEPPAGEYRARRPAGRQVGDIWYDAGICLQEVEVGFPERVACTEEVLPEAEAGKLVVAARGGCYLVRDVHEEKPQSFELRRVRCPADGPNVIVPDHGVIWMGSERHWIEPEGLTCLAEVQSNPPHSKKVDCDQRLMPQLTNGLTPDEKRNGRCYYDEHEVSCSPARDEQRSPAR